MINEIAANGHTVVRAASEQENSAMLEAGFGGFIAMLVIGGLTILLLLDMNRRIRRARYREQVRKKLDAEQDAEQNAEQSSADLTDAEATDTEHDDSSTRDDQSSAGSAPKRTDEDTSA